MIEHRTNIFSFSFNHHILPPSTSTRYLKIGWYKLPFNLVRCFYHLCWTAVASTTLIIYYHSCCDDIRCLLAVWGYQKNSRRREAVKFLMQSLIELNELYHKSIVWTCDASFILNKWLCFFIIISVSENQICNYKSDRTRNPLNTMNKNIPFICKSIINEIDNFIK